MALGFTTCGSTCLDTFLEFELGKAKVIPSLLWLLKVNPSQRSKSRLKDLIVLLLRMLTVVFVVLSLASPRSSLSTKLLQVDNYPAKWNERNIWMPTLLENLEDGFYQLYDRQGTYYERMKRRLFELWLKKWPILTLL